MSTFRSSCLRVAACGLWAVIPVGSQQPTSNGAGFGAVYLDRALDPQTGNVAHLGVAVDASGQFLVSAAGAGGVPPHLVYRFDRTGALLGAFPQPAVHNGSGFGLRDLEFDGQSLLGGSEFGISVFSGSGALVHQILAANGPQPIVQPIAGPVAAQLAVFRALALDPKGNGGNGSLLVADFASPIFEIDFRGNVLATFPNRGWSAYGLARDPVTGNVWVHAGPTGQIEELDRATMQPTGQRLPPIAAGAPGGLSLGSPTGGHHEPWPNRAAFVHLVQGTEDRIAVQRVHLFPGVLGWNELSLEVGKNGGPRTRGVMPFGPGDVLDYRVFDPTMLRNGMPAWVVFNVYLDAARDAYTNFTPVLPGTGILWEHRTLNPISMPGTPVFAIAGVTVGAVTSWTLPASLLAGNDLFRVQALYVEPASPQQFIASSNEANWQANLGERGIVVAAEGPTSYHGGQGQPFWRVASDLTHNHGAITGLEITAIGASGPGALQRFDVDQDGMNDRFDGGNSTTPGFLGTYRAGSDALCGLDYQAAGVFTAPFHGPGQSAGVRFSAPPDAAGHTQDLHFAFTTFAPGRTFLFDCDTDGGSPAGSDHAGLLVRVTTANSGVLAGVLQVDPNLPDRAVVWFP